MKLSVDSDYLPGEGHFSLVVFFKPCGKSRTVCGAKSTQVLFES